MAPCATRMARLFHRLSCVILPHWMHHVHAHYSKAVRKSWSYCGATAQGDLGNRVYKMVVDIAQLMRKDLRLAPLWDLDTLNMESKGDVLEGIMGLQWLGLGWGWQHQARPQI